VKNLKLWFWSRSSKTERYYKMATRLNRKRPQGHPWAADDFVRAWHGGKCSAWGIVPIPDFPFWSQQRHEGNYDLNAYVYDWPEQDPFTGKPTTQTQRYAWQNVTLVN